MLQIKNGSLKAYIISISVLFTFFITVLVISFSYYSFNSLLEKNLIQSTSYKLHLASETISRDMLPVISFSNWSENNTYLSKYIDVSSKMGQLKNVYLDQKSEIAENAYDEAKNQVKIQSLNSWKRLQEEYRNNRSSQYINRVIVSNHFGNYLHVSTSISYHAQVIYDVITGLDDFDTQFNSNILFLTGIIKDQLSDNDNEYILPIIRPVYASFSNEIGGWCYISVSSHIITDAFKNYNLPEDSQLFITINNRSYKLNNQTLEEVTFVNDISSFSDTDDTQTYEIEDSSGNIYDVVFVKSSIKGISLLQSLSLREFSEQKKVYYFLLIFVTFIVLFLGFLLTFILNRKINIPLVQLIHKMDLISSGDFTKDPTIEWPNELGSIGKGINNLAENVVVLMDKRIEVEKEKTDLEYQILQSQINPHFLYNTLNSIKWMATIQNATGIAEMTTALSRLLRSVTKDTKQIHSIKEEIGLLDHYFLIQKYRYGGTLNLQYDIKDESLLNCQIPKFTLQPVVENAIFHGIEPKASVGNITISIFSKNNTELYIHIQDDGIGMTDEQIADILSPKTMKKSDFFKKIGINNVNLRIQQAFGSDCGLSIISTPNIGTTMIIKLIRRENI